MAEKAPLHALIGHTAERQHGHITREQLLALGLSPRAVTSQVDAGKLIRVHSGVYAVGHVPRGALSRSHAAVLACGAGAALSYESAVAHWGLREWPRVPEVTAPSRHTRPGIRTHRSTTVAGDVWTRNGIRTTNPVRTIADIAPRRTYEKEKLIVELDGWPYHRGLRSFNDDHQRDSDHRTLGFDTIRYTGEQLTVEAANLHRRLSR